MRGLRALVLIALLAFTVGAAPSGGAVAFDQHVQHWVLQHSGAAADLADISCASPSQCLAVGAKATILKTANGGMTWQPVSTPYGVAHPSASFVSVRCPVPGVCSVLAVPNIVLHTTDAGRTWQTSSITLPPLLSRLGRLACPTRNVCFATASPSGGTDTWFTHSAAIWESSDGNRSWQRLQTPDSVPCPGDCNQRPVGFDLQWISCQNSQSCRAGGDTFIGSHEGYSNAVLQSNNGGSTWKLAHHDFDPNIATCPTVSVCTGVFYQPLTPNVGPDLMRSTDGGRTWTMQPMTPILTAIACTGNTFCALVGQHGKLAVAIGMHLYGQASPTASNLNAVACPRQTVCYAVGAGGVILASKT